MAERERARLLIVGGNGSTEGRFARVWPILEEQFRPAVVEVAGQGGRARTFEGAGRHGWIKSRSEGGRLERRPATFAGFADDLAEELERAAEGEPALCYGHGIGGLLLAHAVRRKPEIAHRLILHAPVGAHLARRRFPWLMASAPVRWLVQRLLSAPVLGDRVLGCLFEPGGAASGADRRAFVEGYRQARSFGALFAATDMLAVKDGLEELRLPVTLLWGGEDRVLRLEQLPAWAEALRAAPVTARVVPHWRHYPYVDRPAEFAVVLADCLTDRLPEEPVPLDALLTFQPRTKAGRLASMLCSGLPVPRGWWVPAVSLENGTAAGLFTSLPADGRYAVRSSSLDEDQADQTAAGVYESELDVTTDGLHAACERVSGSAFGARRLAFDGAGSNTEGPTPNAQRRPCDVVVQEMAPRAAGGVAWVRALGMDLEIGAGAFDRAVAGAEGVTRASLSILGAPWTHIPADLPAGLSERRLWRGLWPLLRRAHAFLETGTLDMEWCWDGQGAFWVLQARPVGDQHPARRLLTAANLREVTPPDPSPFLVGATEAVSRALPRYYARLDHGVAGWDEPFTVTIASRPYINVDFYAALLDRWGLPRAMVSQSIGGSIPPRGLRPGRLLLSLPALLRLMADWTRLSPADERKLTRLWDELEVAESLPDLAAWFVSAYQALVEGMFRITSALAAARPLWPGESPEVVTAAMAAELRAAELAGTPEARDAFRQRWGHRGEYESDPAWPRGAETGRPDEALMGRQRDGGIGLEDGLHASRSRAQSSRLPVSPSPLAVLPGLVRRFPVVAPGHLRAHREWFKDGAMRLWAVFRSRMLAGAAVLVREGALDSPEQIWLLSPMEIRRLSPSRWRALAVERSGQQPAAVSPALFWSDTLAGLEPAAGARRADDRLPLVAGIVRGPALVARTPSEALAQLDAEPAGLGGGRPILLAPAVDPGWLPVFLRVAGVATELGGRLSHAATLLRELRVPSVLNLAGATGLARTGEMVELRVPPGEVRIWTE